MRKDNFESLRKSVEQMVAFETGRGITPARQTTYVGKVLSEIRIDGKVAWSLSVAARSLKSEIQKRTVASYGDLVREMMDVLGQSDEGFAQLMGVPVGTVRGWKSGRREPRGPARKLLEITVSSPNAVFEASRSPFRFG